MGKRKTQRKNAILDSDDADTASSSSFAGSDYMGVSGAEEIQFDRESYLDQQLDALFEKRGSTREKALVSISEAFTTNLHHEFVDKKFATLLHQCLNSVKRGSAKEISLASHVIGLLALTAGPGDKAREIFKESTSPISEALRSRSEPSKISALQECLAIVTFIGGEDPEEIKKSMQTMWQVVQPKLGPNVVVSKPSPAIITSVVSAWSFLLTTMNRWALDAKSWQEAISYFSTLLDKDDRSIRIAAGEALALIFEVGEFEKCSGDSSLKELVHIQGLRAKILEQVRSLSMEAGGKGSAKKDLNSQRNTFRDILEFLEDGYSPEASLKVGGASLATKTWAELIQLNFFKRFLGGGFVKHMQENELLQDTFNFIPNRKLASDNEHRVSASEKRLFKSPNSVLNKARTQLLNKQRMLAQGKNIGHFAVGSDQ